MSRDQVRAVSQTSLNREFALLRQAINRAKKPGGWQVPEIDWSDFIDIRRETKRQRVLSAAEEERLMAELAPHLRPFIAFTLMVGQRDTEVAKLTWEQVDMHARQVHFVTKSHEDQHINSVPLNDDAWQILVDIGPQKSGRVWLYPEPQKGGGVALRRFTSCKTGFKAACRRAGITGLRFHDLRRSFGTRLHRNGVPIGVIQKLYDHADVRTTERYIVTDDRDSPAAVASLTKSYSGHTERKIGAK